MNLIKNIRFSILESKTVAQKEDVDNPWLLVVGGIALIIIALL